jgi:hypothetical protein
LVYKNVPFYEIVHSAPCFERWVELHKGFWIHVSGIEIGFDLIKDSLVVYI